MTFSPYPKRMPREKARPSRIPAVSKEWDPTWWPAQSERVHELQDGICVSCDERVHRLDATHIVPLETFATRNDSEHPLNQIDNLLGQCRRCHFHFDRQSKAWRVHRGVELKAKLETLPGHGARRGP